VLYGARRRVYADSYGGPFARYVVPVKRWLQDFF
jgi:hypothetical protein